MMSWDIRITDEAKKDYNKIEGSIRKQVLAAKLYDKYGDDICHTARAGSKVSASES